MTITVTIADHDSEAGSGHAQRIWALRPEVEEDRGEKIRAARKLLGQNNTETVKKVSGSNLASDEPVRARDIAAAIVGVNPLYVQWALRLEREDPELFLKVWNGQITISAAMRVLDGITDSEYMRQFKALRRELNAIWRAAETPPDFLKLLDQFLDQFRAPD